MNSFSKVQRRNLFGILLFTFTTLLVIFVSFSYLPIIWSLILSTLFYHSFLPLAYFLESHIKLSRATTSLLFLILFFLGGGLLIFFGLPQISEQFNDIVRTLQSADYLNYRNEINSYIAQYKEHPILSQIPAFEVPIKDWVLGFIKVIGANLYSSLIAFILTPIVTYFFLKDGFAFKNYLFSFVPNPIFEFYSELQAEITFKMGAFIRARLLESVIVGVLVFAGLHLLDRPNALVLSIFAGAMNLLPYIGPLIGALPPLILTLIYQDPMSTLLLTALLFAVVQFLDGFILMPALMSRIVNLHPLAAIASVLVGGQLLGVLGIVISIPICLTLQILLSNLRQIHSLS